MGVNKNEPIKIKLSVDIFVDKGFSENGNIYNQIELLTLNKTTVEEIRNKLNNLVMKVNDEIKDNTTLDIALKERQNWIADKLKEITKGEEKV